MKNKVTLFDKATGKSLVLATEDSFNSNLVLMLPTKNGTLALVEDLVEIQNFLQNGQLTASDSSKLGGKLPSDYVLTDMSNVNLAGLSPTILNGLKGYTGSQGVSGIKGDVGSGFSISIIFDSLAELLAGTTTEETFAMVGGILPQSDPDFGKLYLRKNNTWNYVTDLSVEGAAGIQGPVGYTGSAGPQGPTGYNGSIGAIGLQGVIGYTGSKGDSGTVSTAGPSGGVNGDTWYQY